MKLNCEVRQASSNLDAKHYDTARIRQEYLVEKVMAPDEINMVYSMFDRIIAGGAVPVKEELLLSAPDILRAEWFTQRRELGIINVGGSGSVLVGDEEARRACPSVLPAKEEDYFTEYLSLKLSVRTVEGVEEAIAWINAHSTRHSEAIVTSDARAAERFLREVDSACVYVNASTRFTDGFEFGFGAEMGISTQKLHARGPMGLRELTTYKYLIRGNGQIRR